MSEPREILRGSHKAAAAGARLIGPTNPGEPVRVTVVIARKSAIPRSELARHSRTRPRERPRADHEAVAQGYGASQEALDAVTSFAAQYHLAITSIDQARRLVELTGTAADMEKAFGTELHDCAIGARTYRGRRGPLLLPANTLPHVEAVLGLDNRPVARPRMRPRSAGPSFYPQELARLYGFPGGDGSGQTVALIELGGNLDAGDLRTYFGEAGVAVPNVRSVNVGAHVPVPYGQDKDSDGEVMLDIEVVGAIAPAAQIVVYFANNTDQGFYLAASQAVHDPATTAVSISWGSPEKDWSQQTMEAWNSLGQTATLLHVPMFVAAGDHGCTDEESGETGFDAQRHADFPGTCSNGVVCCGGTRIQAEQGAITAETVWNDGDGWATGGGVSTHFTVPDGQSGLCAVTGSPLIMRGVPDVGGLAGPQTGIHVRADGADGVSGGTSAVAPQWAALTALLSQQLGRRPGFFLPLLYQNAQTGATRDIVSGNNSVFGVAGYSAQQGWDACTGLGSPNGAMLLALLAGSAPADGADSPGLSPPATVLVPSGAGAPGTARAPAAFDANAATLYGQLVSAAYTMYNADPNNLTPAPSADFPASYQLTAWVQMRDFVIGSTGPQFYGFIARSNADPGAYVLAIRGTSNAVEWWDDANAGIRTPFRVPGCGSVGAGFARIYDTLEVIEKAPAAGAAVARSLRPLGGFSQQVASHLKGQSAARARTPGVPSAATLEVTGHSLGAALATLYAQENGHTDQVATTRLCTFASPAVGDSTFVSVLNGLGLASWRIVNRPDLVPRLPPEILGFRHVDALQELNSAGKVKSSLTCWHSIATYLSLLSPGLQPGSDCQVAPAVPARAPTPSVTVSQVSPAGQGVTVNITVNVGDAGAAR
jgi:kumamolisin